MFGGKFQEAEARARETASHIGVLMAMGFIYAMCEPRLGGRM